MQCELKSSSALKILSCMTTPVHRTLLINALFLSHLLTLQSLSNHYVSCCAMNHHRYAFIHRLCRSTNFFDFHPSQTRTNHLICVCFIPVQRIGPPNTLPLKRRVLIIKRKVNSQRRAVNYHTPPEL